MNRSYNISLKGLDIYQLEAKDRFGKTALERAAEYGNEATVLALLKAGADMEARDAQGTVWILSEGEKMMAGTTCHAQATAKPGYVSFGMHNFAHGIRVAQSRPRRHPLQLQRQCPQNPHRITR